MSEDITRAQHVGRLVRAALTEHGRTQNDVADVLGLTYAAVSRRILGHVSFRADELMQIAEQLGIEPSRFLRRVPQPRAPQAARPVADLADLDEGRLVDEEPSPAGARGAA